MLIKVLVFSEREPHSDLVALVFGEEWKCDGWDGEDRECDEGEFLSRYFWVGVLYFGD